MRLWAKILRFLSPTVRSTYIKFRKHRFTANPIGFSKLQLEKHILWLEPKPGSKTHQSIWIKTCMIMHYYSKVHSLMIYTPYYQINHYVWIQIVDFSLSVSKYHCNHCHFTKEIEYSVFGKCLLWGLWKSQSNHNICFWRCALSFLCNKNAKHCFRLCCGGGGGGLVRERWRKTWGYNV